MPVCRGQRSSEGSHRTSHHLLSDSAHGRTHHLPTARRPPFFEDLPSCRSVRRACGDHYPHEDLSSPHKNISSPLEDSLSSRLKSLLPIELLSIINTTSENSARLALLSLPSTTFIEMLQNGHGCAASPRSCIRAPRWNDFACVSALCDSTSFPKGQAIPLPSPVLHPRSASERRCQSDNQPTKQTASRQPRTRELGSVQLQAV
eukprot:1849308-Prymnesium_polylepis.2